MNLKAFEPLWGSWHLLEPIGQGSSGTVYRAEQKVFDHTYFSAVKHISLPRDAYELRAVQEELGTEDTDTLSSYYEQEVASILEEYDVQKQFSGKRHFAAVQDVLAVPKQGMPGYDLFIRMELLSSIQKRFQDAENREEQAIVLGIQICEALHEMHSAHFMHRDIKPQNILVSADGEYKLADFGTARRLAGNATFMSVKGSLDYIPPEVMTGAEVGYNADLYSLGLVLYRLLNHWRAPFMPQDRVSAAERDRATARRLAGEKLPPPDEASPKMADVILRACAYRPENRWASAQQMQKALQQLLGGKEEEVRPKYTQDECPTESNQEDTAPDLVRRLSGQMDLWEQRLKEPITKASLVRIQNRLVRMDPHLPEVAAASARCAELLRRQEQAAGKRQTNPEKRNAAGENGADARAPGRAGTRNGTEEKMKEKPAESPSRKRPVPEEKPLQPIRVPVGPSAVLWLNVLVSVWLTVAAGGCIGNAPVFAWPIALLMILSLLFFLVSRINKGVGRSFQAARSSGDTIRCTWKPREGRRYGIVMDGKWVSQDAVSPLKVPDLAHRVRKIQLVSLGRKPHLLKTLHAKNVNGKELFS